MYRVRVRSDLPDVRRLMKRLEAGTTRPALARIGEEGVRLSRETFERSTDPYGSRWQPLADSTLQSLVYVAGQPPRPRWTFGTKPLVRTRALMESLDWAFTPAGGGVQVRIFAGMPYGVYHQGDASMQSRGVLPRRMFLPTPERGLPPRWVDRFTGVIERHLEGGSP